jgi:hypothetical protein
MRSLTGATLIGLSIYLGGQPAIAGVYTDDMSKCLVNSSTQADQTLLVQWIFSAMAFHPAVKPMANVTAEQATALTRKAAELSQRLLTVDCRKEVVTALKYEGTSSLEASFSVLGQVAMRGMLSDPAVAKSTGAIATYLDEAKIKALMTEAGVPTLPAPTTTPAKQ